MPVVISVYYKITPKLPDDVINVIRLYIKPRGLWSDVYKNICHKDCKCTLGTKQTAPSPIIHLIKNSIPQGEKFSTEIIQIDPFAPFPRPGDMVCDHFFKVVDMKNKISSKLRNISNRIKMISLEIGGQKVLWEEKNFIIFELKDRDSNPFYLVGARETSWPVPLIALQYHDVRMKIEFHDKDLEAFGAQATYIFYDTQERRDIATYSWQIGPYQDIRVMSGMAGMKYTSFSNKERYERRKKDSKEIKEQGYREYREYIHTFYTNSQDLFEKPTPIIARSQITTGSQITVMNNEPMGLPADFETLF